MNKRIRKKRAKLSPMNCVFCGSKIKAVPWGNWWQVNCSIYSCNSLFFILAKKKKDAIKGWNRQMELIKKEEQNNE